MHIYIYAIVSLHFLYSRHTRREYNRAMFKRLLLGDVKVLSSEKSPLVMKDVKWYTYNCTVGYMISG